MLCSVVALVCFHWVLIHAQVPGAIAGGYCGSTKALLECASDADLPRRHAGGPPPATGIAPFFLDM